MNEPLVSVIIPVYNTEAYLKECLDSVLNQTLKDIEIICVDNGSNDNSLNILKEYQEKDKRIKIIEKPFQNAGTGRNDGLKVARGKYLSFLDSDDIFSLDMLETMYKKIDIENSDVVVCGFMTFDNTTGNIMKYYRVNRELFRIAPFNPKQINTKLFDLMKPNAWTKLFRREFFIKNNLHFEDCVCCNDLTCVLTALSRANKISILRNCFVKYRVNQNHSITAGRKNNMRSVLFALQKLHDNLDEVGMYDIYKDTYRDKVTVSFLWNRTIYNDRYKIISLKKTLDNSLKDKVIGEDLYNILYAKLLELEAKNV